MRSPGINGKGELRGLEGNRLTQVHLEKWPLKRSVCAQENTRKGCGQGYELFSLNNGHAMCHSKWREIIRERIGVTVMVIVMLRVEYELYISGSGSPGLTWI